MDIEHRRLPRKIKKLDEYELCDDDINESNESGDKNYIESTPVKRKNFSLTQKIGVKTAERKGRNKKKGQRSEEGNDSERESRFFLTKKERKQLCKKDREVDKSSENESENDNSNEEESVFFLTRKLKEERAKQRMRGETQKKKRKSAEINRT